MLVAPLEMISKVYSSFWTKYLKKVLQFFHCFYQFSINPATIFQYASEADKMKYNIYMMLLSKPVLLPCVSDSFVVGFERIFWFRVATTSSFISLRKNVRQVRVNNILLGVVETTLQLIFHIFKWPQKASKLWVKIPQNILVQIGLKWLHINTYS